MELLTFRFPHNTSQLHLSATLFQLTPPLILLERSLPQTSIWTFLFPFIWLKSFRQKMRSMPKIMRFAKWVFLSFKNLTHPFNSYIVKSWKFESIRIRQTEVPTTYWLRLAHDETLSWLKREKGGLLFLALAKVQNLTNSHNIHLWNWPEKQNFNSEPIRVLWDTVLLWFSKYLLFTRPAIQNV